MRRHLLAATLLLLVPLSLGSNDARKQEGLESIPGLIGNTATDATISYIYALEHFRAYPDHPRFYFSEGTANSAAELLDGALAVGVDTNPCTMDRPCRTIDKMEQVANRGNVHIILDKYDDWDLAADWTAGGGDGSITMNDPPDCTSPNEACVVFSSTAFSPLNRARLTCTLAPATSTLGLFDWKVTSDRGWLALENIELNNCPASIVGPVLDMIRNGDSVVGPGKIVALNIKMVTGVRGSDLDAGQNDFYTSHSTDSVGVLLNSEPFIENSGVGYAADLFDASRGDMIIIGQSELYSLDVDGSWFAAQSESPTLSSEIVMIGHTIIDRIGFANSYGISMQAGGAVGVSHRIFLADVTIANISGANGAGVQTLNSANNVSSMFASLFRVTMRGINGWALIGQVSPGLVHTFFGRCVMFDELVAGFLNVFETNVVGRAASDKTGTQIDLEGLFDNEAAGTHYTLMTDNYATAALADAAAANYHVFDTDSIDSGAGANGDAYGTLLNQSACNSADCRNRCGANKFGDWTFARYEIPKIVLGTSVKSLHLGGTAKHYGAR